MGGRRTSARSGDRHPRQLRQGAPDQPQRRALQVEGPHLVSPSPQRTPLLFQAGASEVGPTFAAKNAEAVFMQSPNLRGGGEAQGSRTRRADLPVIRLIC